MSELIIFSAFILDVLVKEETSFTLQSTMPFQDAAVFVVAQYADGICNLKFKGLFQKYRLFHRIIES